MSIIGWFKRKKREKKDLETALSEIQRAIEELPSPLPPIKVPSKFDIFLQTIERVVKK